MNLQLLSFNKNGAHCFASSCRPHAELWSKRSRSIQMRHRMRQRCLVQCWQMHTNTVHRLQHVLQVLSQLCGCGDMLRVGQCMRASLQCGHAQYSSNDNVFTASSSCRSNRRYISASLCYFFCLKTKHTTHILCLLL